MLNVAPPFSAFEWASSVSSGTRRLNARLHRLQPLAGSNPYERAWGPRGTPALLQAAFERSQDRDGPFKPRGMAGISATTDLDDALADLKYHTALFHKASRNDGPAVREMLHLSFQFEAEVVEVPLEPESARFLDPNDWTASHLLARTAARSNAHAILYPTTRGRGPSLVVYRPDGISDFAAERLQLQWNGASFD